MEEALGWWNRRIDVVEVNVAPSPDDEARLDIEIQQSARHEGHAHAGLPLLSNHSGGIGMPQSAQLGRRSFQDFVDEARTLIPRYCPEWTDHNLSDPGIAIVEVFAFMMESLLYRLNQVPRTQLHQVPGPDGRQAAGAPAGTGRHQLPPDRGAAGRRHDPTGTEVATVRTESQDAISFTTERDLTIDIASLREVLVTRDASNYFDARMAVQRGQDVAIFADPPQEGNALYIGHAEALAGQTLALRFECRLRASASTRVTHRLPGKRGPPMRMRAFLDVESDTTGGLNRNGTVVVHVPYAASRSTINNTEASWIRVRLLPPRPDQRGYSASPQVRGLTTEIIGGTVPASHGVPLQNVLVGRSDGRPNQTFRLNNYPLLPHIEGETVEVETARASGRNGSRCRTSPIRQPGTRTISVC